LCLRVILNTSLVAIEPPATSSVTPGDPAGRQGLCNRGLCVSVERRANR